LNFTQAFYSEKFCIELVVYPANPIVSNDIEWVRIEAAVASVNYEALARCMV